MSKRRKKSSYGGLKVEVKEENVMGNDYLMAKGRLEGVLKQLTERSDSDSDSSDDDSGRNHRRSHYRRHASDAPPRPIHHTYVMKLFDRSVDLAQFEEETPLYPICRAWMANQPRNPQSIVKRRHSSPEGDANYWNGNMTEINRLPPPLGSCTTRIPSPLPEQKTQIKEEIDLILHYDDKPPCPRDELIRNHLKRWTNVKRKWMTVAQNNDERYYRSSQILQAIYNRAQESIE